MRGRRPYAPGVPLSQSYVCFRCGKPGHFIRNCPTNGVSAGKQTLELYESECEILPGSVFSQCHCGQIQKAVLKIICFHLSVDITLHLPWFRITASTNWLKSLVPVF